MEVRDKSALDVAVLLEKAVLLNGMLLHGTSEQKKMARIEWEALAIEIRLHVPLEAFELAKRELTIDQDHISIKLFDLLPNN